LRPRDFEHREVHDGHRGRPIQNNRRAIENGNRGMRLYCEHGVSAMIFFVAAGVRLICRAESGT